MSGEMKRKGSWIGYHQTLTYDALNRIGVAGRLADDVVRQLSAYGLLVSSAYYVPTIDELYRSWTQIRYLGRGDVRCHWVMCAETWAALGQQHGPRSKVAALPIDFSWSMAVEESPQAAFTADTVFVVDSTGGLLLGVPVRIDPTARRPMWEATA